MITKLAELSAHDLTCVRQQLKIFTHVNFSLCAGDMLIVQGRNGSGKSSLLRILSGVATPASGHLVWRGELVHQYSEYFKSLHYLSHTSGNKLNLTVIENLYLHASLLQQPLTNSKNVLELLDLSSVINRLVATLSAGQKRKLGLARLMLFAKQVLILDEPCTSLDQQTQLVFFDFLRQHLQTGGICILSTHHDLPLNINVKFLNLTC